ncbi:MAG: translesion DNA synthesis-associated protein ImuA [Corallincola sp.]|nr:translesion DNA synthesis-associated protein ImuA [Corallincola sp.]
MAMAELLASGQLWQGEAAARVSPEERLATGWSWLDQQLLADGWPPRALIELLVDAPGQGELRLLSRALAGLAADPRWQLWINPPATPYPPALRAAGVALERQLLGRALTPPLALWCAEQGVASGSCSMVLAWLPQLELAQLRRLQLAAERGHCRCFVIRPLAAASHSSPAAVRLQLQWVADGLQLTVLKRRGGWPLPPALWPLAS